MSLAAYRSAAAEYAAAERRVKRLADAKACAVLDMARAGWSVTQIAHGLGVTRARVSQLLARARALPDVTASEHASLAGVVISDDMMRDARRRVTELRARVRAEATAARTESLRILDGADALTITPPTDRSIGEWDWIRRLDRYERVRLARWWSKNPGHSVDNVADSLRVALPAFGDYGTDEIIRRVWLYHCRMVDAAGYVAKRGKVPPSRYYGNAIDVAGMAPSVAGDGYDVAMVLGDGDDAARHVATVDATRGADDAYRMLGETATCRYGPAPWAMSCDAYVTELLAIDAQLRGHDALERSEPDTRARHAELVPKLLDDGADYPTLHTRIVDTARLAGVA